MEMARFLQELARQSNANNMRLTPLMVRERMIKRFGASNYFKYKKSIMRDLALITVSSKSAPRGRSLMGSSAPGAAQGPHFEVSTGDIIKQLEGLSQDADFASIYEEEQVPAGTALEHVKALAMEFELNRRSASSMDAKTSDPRASSTTINVAVGDEQNTNTIRSLSRDRYNDGRRVLKDHDGKVCFSTPAALVDILCDPNRKRELGHMHKAIILTYPQFCTAAELALLMVEKLDYLMAVEDFNRVSLLVSLFQRFLEQLSIYRRSSASADALAILECYVNRSLEENAEHAHLPQHIQKLVQLSNSIKGLRNQGLEDYLNDYSALSQPRVLVCMQAWPVIHVPEKLRKSRDDLFQRATPQQVAEQMTLIVAAVYKRIQPRELISTTRKDSANLQHLITIFQKCALWVEWELLKDSLDLTTRVKMCERIINIACLCAKLGNFLVCTGLLSGLTQFTIPKALWDCVNVKHRELFAKLESRFLSPRSQMQSYKDGMQQFEGRFHMPNLFIPLREFELKVDSQPSCHRDFSELVNVKKCLDLYAIISKFLEPQKYPCNITPHHHLQMGIAYRMSCCGKVKSTGASTTDRMVSNSEKRKKVASQIEIESLANSLNFLG